MTVSGNEGGGAANGTANQIVSVIQTVLAAQLVSKGGMLANVGDTSDGDKRQRIVTLASFWIPTIRQQFFWPKFDNKLSDSKSVATGEAPESYEQRSPASLR